MNAVPALPVATRWFYVAALFLAGCTSAFHIGKMPAALPALSVELDLDLVATAWLVSLFSVLSASLGLLVALLAVNAPRTASVAGFVIAGLASLVASYLHDQSHLLMTRALEGLGWILVAITVPMLLAAVSSPRDRPLVMGIWGAFLPVGMAFSLWITPSILAIGDWRLLWQITGSSSLLAGVVIWAASRHSTVIKAQRWTWSEIHRTLWRPVPLLMFGCFLVYSAQFLALFSFLPTILLESFAIDLTLSANLVAIAIGCNLSGNVMAGWLLRKGVKASRLLLVAMVGLGGFAALVFGGQLPLSLTFVAAVGFAAVGGLIPGTLFALAQQVVSRPALAGIVIGLITQAAGIGQLLGPPALASVVEWAGTWSAALLFTTFVSVGGCICALVLERIGLEPARS